MPKTVPGTQEVLKIIIYSRQPFFTLESLTLLRLISFVQELVGVTHPLVVTASILFVICIFSVVLKDLQKERSCYQISHP